MTKLATITYDLSPEQDTRPPSAGEFISTSRSRYRIVEARPVESKIWPYRWRLLVERLGPHGGTFPPTDWPLRWYRRGERPS